MKFLHKKIMIALLVVAAAGCKKLDIAPTDRFSDLTFWTVDVNVANALNNNYSLLYNSSLYFDPEALSDNAYSPSGDLNLIASGNANALTGKFLGDWSNYYRTIKSVNIFLANIDQNKTLPAATIARMKAENQFMRAFALFNLSKWYGGVPLVITDITPE
ncbi:MAG: RagB/SusD family nutrient uptake outer membrane protein, partial [Pedobacter sp.]